MQASTIDITDHNARIFFDPKLPALYARCGTQPAETTFLRRHAASVQNKRILDLGVGSGRTTGFLLPLAQSYVGIDVADPMLEAARLAFPAARFLNMDLRAIGELGPERFDCVIGAWAILSAFTHKERLGILADVHGLLSAGGTFYFSAHNRQWREAGGAPLNRRSWRPRRIANSLDPVSWYNYLRLRHLRHEAEDHAILNDGAHQWSGVFYYIDRAAQQRQLAATGFELIESYGEDGRILSSNEDVARDGLLHYVCRKAA